MRADVINNRSRNRPQAYTPSDSPYASVRHIPEPGHRHTGFTVIS